jgi:hypothetical protein
LGGESTKDQPASFLLGVRSATHMMEIIIDLRGSLTSGIAAAQ